MSSESHPLWSSQKDRIARPPVQVALPRPTHGFVSTRDSSENTNNPYQDEIGVTLLRGDGNATFLATCGQNKRVERTVRCVRVANGDIPIQRCKIIQQTK